MTAERKDEAKPLSKMNETELLEACKVAGVNPSEEATNTDLIALLEVAAEEAKSLNDVSKDTKPPAAEESDEDKKAKEAKRARDRRTKEKADKAAAEAAELEAEAKRGHFVAEGKSLTSSKGAVVAGDRVTATHWGEGVLERLVTSGAVIEVK